MPTPKPRVSKRKRVDTVNVEDIPDVDTPPSPPQGAHPKLITINSPPIEPVLQGILREEEEVLKLIKQKEARERLQRLKAQLGEEGNSVQNISETSGAPSHSTTAPTPLPGPQLQGNAQAYAQLQAQVPNQPPGGPGYNQQGNMP